MIVTKFKYFLDDRLLQKIDLMIKRCVQTNPKRDAVLLIEGAEGEGKTTYSIALGYYIAEKTGRIFNHTRVFADLEKMMEFIKNTEEEVVIWDEPALQGLSGDIHSRILRNLMRLLMMARKKRHFIIINLAYFNKFNDYIVWQRPLGMIHVYSRNEVQAGRFCYIKKRNLEYLWQDWRRFRKRNYKKWASRGIRGTFPDVLNPEYEHNVLSDFDVKVYEKAKDEAIMKIGAEQQKNNNRLLMLQYKISLIPKKCKEITQEWLCKEIRISRVQLNKWRDIPKKYPEIKELLEEEAEEKDSK